MSRCLRSSSKSIASLTLQMPQALGQCQAFLRTNLPAASAVKMPSTAAAARALLDHPPRFAAICSRICATLLTGLEVLCENIQDQARTHFFPNLFLLLENSNLASRELYPFLCPRVDARHFPPLSDAQRYTIQGTFTNYLREAHITLGI